MFDNKINIKLGKNLESRVTAFKIFILISFFLLGTRLFYLQVLRGADYQEKAKNNHIKIRKLSAPRGKIFDRNGIMLATNIAGYKLAYLDRRDVDPVKIKTITELTGIPEDIIKKRIKNGSIHRYTGENIIVDDIDEDVAHKIMERQTDYPYISVQAYSKRKYPFDRLAAHVIGYVKPITAREYENLKDLGYRKTDIVGKKGIEKQFDEILQGKDGAEYIEVNVKNRLVKKIKSMAPKPGQDIYLTLDLRLQKYMMEVLKGQRASFIAIRVSDGEILTSVSNPEYSLNTHSARFTPEIWKKIIGNKNKPLLNRAVNGSYPPGSVFKVVSAMAFLENGISPSERIFDPGYYSIGSFRWRSWKRGGHGKVDLEKSLIESVNTYYYKLSDDIGHMEITRVAKSLGLGNKVGLDIPEERSGLVPDKVWKKKRYNEGWYKGDTMLISIGQGALLTTSVQIANLYAIFANEGYAYRPHYVKEIKFSDKVVKTKKEINIRYDSKKQYYKIINRALEKVVSSKDGTGKALRNDHFKVAAKTGSAQNRAYKDSHAWAAGFFPYENPEIAFVSFVEGGGSGGGVAAPIAKKFIEKYVQLYSKDKKDVK